MKERYHKGEIEVQELTGERNLAMMNAGMVSDTIPGGAIPFVAQQNFIVLSTIDDQGDIWISMVTGKPGFAKAREDRKAVGLSLASPKQREHDPFFKALAEDSPVGGLFIELATRLRLRVNGKVQNLTDDSMTLAVDQVYPNCPKYIQRRNINVKDTKAVSEVETETGTFLDSVVKAILEKADTLFVGSADDNRHCDASHRGGTAGFVQIVDDQTLRIPDYPGNSMFNTFGNFHMNPKGGLLFLDFEKNRQFHLTGDVTLDLNSADNTGKTGGTNRWWNFTVRKWTSSPLAHQYAWEFVDFSPFNPMQLQIKTINDVAQDIKEFIIVHPDGDDLPAFAAGAHIEITLQGESKKYIRRYSITSNPADLSRYSIAVLRVPNSMGGSKYLHEQIKESDMIEIMGPFQEFGLSQDAPHHIMIAGGIGVTPFVPMIDTLSGTDTPYQLHYAARSDERFAYKERLLQTGGERILFYTDNGNGRSNLDLETLIAEQRAETHFYVCGPRPMIEAFKTKASRHGFPSEQVHYESFGASVKDTDKPVKVKLALSGMEMKVDPGQTILDAILEHGVFAPYECRRGECESCVIQVLSGEPDHRDVCLTKEQRVSKICTCVSWAKSEELELYL